MPSAARFRVILNRLLTRAGFAADWYLIPIAAVIGIFGGLVATGFDLLIEAIATICYGHGEYPGLPMPPLMLYATLPAAGGLLVGLARWFVFHLQQSHGIPMVIESLSRQGGKIPMKFGFAKAINASLTIGTGGSAGVEGPSIQIGSVVGSTVARFLRVSREQVHTLVGCGAAAGMAGIFNAPIAGVMFVLEVLLRDFSVRTCIPIVVASVFGTAMAQALLGSNEAIFTMPLAMTQYEFSMPELLPYAGLGLLCGLLGVVIIGLVGSAGQTWARLKVPGYIRPDIGGALLGGLGLLFLQVWAHPVHGFDSPVFFANGYPVVEAMLNPQSYLPASTALAPDGDGGQRIMSATMLVLLAALLFKLTGTWLTLGSGGAGGIFAPSLFMGACLGGAFGIGLQWLAIFPGVNPATYALAGMAGALAAVAHCPLTAFLLVFEITKNYKVILPVMLVAILATTCAQFFRRDSIYALWLRQRGVRMGTTADLTLLRRLRVADVELVAAVLVQEDDPAARLVELAEEYATVDFAVCDEHNRYIGMVVGEDLRTTLVQREAIPLMIVGELMRTNLPTVLADETLDVVLDKFSRHDVASLALLDGQQQVRGLITRPRLMRSYHRLLSR